MNTKHIFQAALAFALAAICTVGYAQNNDSAVSDTTRPSTSLPEEEEVFWICEQMPKFPGGNDAFKNYLKEHLNSKEGIKPNVKGYYSFIINEQGNVEKVCTARSIDSTIDNVIVNALQSMPQWVPGTMRGKNVKVAFTIPIEYKKDKKGRIYVNMRNLKKLKL